MDREEKIQRVLTILKQRHWERYGTTDVDVRFVRSQPDWYLDRIIEAGE